MALFRDYLGKPVPERQNQSGFYRSKRQWMAVASAGPYASLHLTPRQVTTPAPHHSVFYRPDALPAAQPTASKHWSQTDSRWKHIHTHPFNGPLSGTTRVSWYQKGKPNWTADGNNENKSRSEKFATYRRNNLCAVVNSSRELIKCRLCFRQTQVIHHVIKSRKSL